MKNSATPKKNWKYYLQGIALSIVSLVMVLLLLNYILKPKSTHESGMDWQAYNDSINQRNQHFANENPYGFTDRARNYQKGSSTFRIAVLGDSFIWGDGIPYEMVWSHRLEQKLQRYNKNIEVLHWGKNGWSTLNELDFYLSEGHKYDVDLLLVGLVTNDPDMGDNPQITKLEADSTWLEQKMPWLAQFISEKVLAYHYGQWEDALYSEANLRKYQELLVSFDATMKADSLQYMFVVTPNDIRGNSGERNGHLTRIMSEVEIPYLNLLPKMESQFTKFDELEASPINPHPGPILTEMFAESVYLYLLQANHLPQP